MPTQTVYRPESSGKSFWLILDKMTPKIHFDETGGQMSLHVVDCPPGGGPPPHMHTREDEFFFVLEGEFSFLQDDTLVRCPAGHGVLAKRNGVHTFKNTHTGWSKMLVYAIGGPFEKFAMEMAQPCADEVEPPPVSPERIAQLMAITPKYGLEMKLDWPAPTRKAQVSPPTDRVWVLGCRIDFVVTGDETNHKYIAIDVTAWPNMGPPPHIHDKESECFYFIDGEFEVTLGNEKKLVRKGDAVFIPEGVVHGFKCVSRRPGRFVALHHGHGVEGFFREIGAPVTDPNTPPTFADDFDRVIASASRNGMRFA